MIIKKKNCKPLIKQLDIFTSIDGLVKINYIIDGISNDYDDINIKNLWLLYFMSIPKIINHFYLTKFNFKLLNNYGQNTIDNFFFYF